MNKKIIAKALNLLGILLMITVILIMVPIAVPKLMGIRIYGVLTGSMAPAYSVGGVVYVIEATPDEIETGDVITFRMGTNTEYVMTHRVVQHEDGCFITKGDANNAADPEPVAYERLIGKAVFYLPGMADVATFVNSTTGRSIFIMMFAAAFICFVAADMISPIKERKSHKKSGLGIQLIGVVLIVGSVVYLAAAFWGYQQSKKEYSSLEDNIFENTSLTDQDDGIPKEKNSTDNEEDILSREDEIILQNINKLHAENNDLVGWIRFDNLDISYPIMQADNNEYYLDHTFSGETNSAGSIFLEAMNASDFEDSHTIVYGHNMKNQSMFGALKNYKTKDFYDGNEFFTIYTLTDAYRYQIFAFYDISMYGDLYNVGFEADAYFQSAIDEMVRCSYYDTGIRPDKADKIMTLSTCSTEGNRFVVNAVRIK